MSFSTDTEVTTRLTHVLWIGGATDSGKSTVAHHLAEQWDIPVYHYDREDARQTEILAKSIPVVSQFLHASLEERWIQPTPETMFEYLLLTFPYRFQLVIQELMEMSRERTVIAEGFGLLPELVHPVLSSPYQAIWLAPTEAFKWDSMIRRGKPSFAAQVSDPQKARMNLLARDKMLADYYRQQVPLYGYRILEVDGSLSAEEMTRQVEVHFSKYVTLPVNTST